MVHVVVRSQKQVLDTMLIIKRGAFHQTVLNNGATIVKCVFLQVLTHVHHLVSLKSVDQI